jgi:hypothetical protein
MLQRGLSNLEHRARIEVRQLACRLDLHKSGDVVGEGVQNKGTWWSLQLLPWSSSCKRITELWTSRDVSYSVGSRRSRGLTVRRSWLVRHSDILTEACCIFSLLLQGKSRDGLLPGHCPYFKSFPTLLSSVKLKKKKTKLRGNYPRANYNDRAIAAYHRS